jgi:hypothetical protein
MKCARVKRWLHFFRQEELSLRQKQAMEKHLEICASCRALSREIQRLSASIDAVRKAVPDLDDSYVVTDRIMSAIEQHERYDHSNTRFQFLQWMSKPRVRLAWGCLLLFNMAVFFIQEIQITNRISTLEQKMKRTAPVPKSVFAQCLSSAHDIENMLLNDEINGFIHQIQSSSIQDVLFVRHVFLFRQLSADQQLKIIKACRQLNDRYHYYQSFQTIDTLKKELYLKGVLP